MKVVVTRVSQASCTIDGKVHSKTGKGFLLLVGIHQDDTEKDLEKVAHKISRLRVFEDDNGKMNLDIHQVNGEILSMVPLPVGGILSEEPLAVIASQVEKLTDALKSLGYEHYNVIMSLSTLSLPVSPALKITDYGLIAVNEGKVVSFEV